MLVTLTRAVLEGASAAGVRALIVGGAASLRLPELLERVRELEERIEVLESEGETET